MHDVICGRFTFNGGKSLNVRFFSITSPITRGYGSVLEALSKLVARVAQPRFTLDTLVDYTYP